LMSLRFLRDYVADSQLVLHCGKAVRPWATPPVAGSERAGGEM
jgi:hypothetical protein